MVTIASSQTSVGRSAFAEESRGLRCDCLRALRELPALLAAAGVTTDQMAVLQARWRRRRSVGSARQLVADAPAAVMPSFGPHAAAWHAHIGWYRRTRRGGTHAAPWCPAAGDASPPPGAALPQRAVLRKLGAGEGHLVAQRAHGVGAGTKHPHLRRGGVGGRAVDESQGGAAMRGAAERACMCQRPQPRPAAAGPTPGGCGCPARSGGCPAPPPAA